MHCICKQIIGDVKKSLFSNIKYQRHDTIYYLKKEKKIENVIQKQNTKFGVAINIRRKIDSTSKADAGQ